LQKAYQHYENGKAFPYWAKLWPSAFVLTEFIKDNLDLIRNKKVLELAAGLGLPSLFSSHFASSVLCSDYDHFAIEFIKENIALNNIGNMASEMINWTKLPPQLDSEVLLLSDINYNPKDYDILLNLMRFFLAKGNTILLSTPQRLAAKPFITALLPWCIRNEEWWHDHVAINVLVLKSL